MTFFNRVKFIAAAGGLADFTVSTNAVGYRTPAGASVPDGTPVSYVAQSANLLEWEAGHGTYTAVVVARTTVLDSSNANAKVNFTDPPNVWFDCLAQDLRAVLTVDTIYYVATTGSDTTGDGTVGNPWATIQYGVDFVMYNVTGKGVRVTIQVADGIYTEALNLGPHQIFAPEAVYSGPVLKFSDPTTPGNVILSPSAVVGSAGGVVFGCYNSLWQIAGGFTITSGGSGDCSVFAAVDGGQLYLGSDTGGSNVSIVCTDNIVIFVDCENTSNFSIGGVTTSTVTFNSTVGTLVLCDQGSRVNFYPQVDVHFDIDPGFAGWAGGQPGMFDMEHGGGAVTVMRNTYSGVSPAAPVASVISNGNSLVELHPIQSLSDYTVNNHASYNGNYAGPISVSSGTNDTPLLLKSTSAFDGPVIEYINPTLSGSPDFFSGIGSIGNWVVFDVIANRTEISVGAIGVVTYQSGVFGFTADDYIISAPDTGTSRIAAKVIAAGNGTQGDTSGTFVSTISKLIPTTIAALPGTPAAGMIAAVSDGDPGLAWGATVVNSGAGSDYYTVNYNGANWTVIGK